jgi:glyoxylase-like metal-dependent hydrolase (beta-lactamase superfamily II)
MLARGSPEIADGVFWLRFRYANVFMIRSGSAWALIDTAFPGFERAILAAARVRFGDAPPAAILLTHGHFDHSGSAAALARHWGLPVHVFRDELPYVAGLQHYPEIEEPDPPAGGLMRLFVASNMPRFVRKRLETKLVARETLGDVARGFDPDDGVPGLADWQAIPTPGHSPGHVAFWRARDRVLVSGDALLTVDADSLWGVLLNRPQIARPPSPVTVDWRQAKASVAALARLRPRVLAAGHGTPLTHPAVADDLQAFARRFAGAAGQGAEP